MLHFIINVALKMHPHPKKIEKFVVHNRLMRNKIFEFIGQEGLRLLRGNKDDMLWSAIKFKLLMYFSSMANLYELEILKYF